MLTNIDTEVLDDNASLSSVEIPRSVDFSSDFFRPTRSTKQNEVELVR